MQEAQVIRKHNKTHIEKSWIIADILISRQGNIYGNMPDGACPEIEERHNITRQI